jgi:hypothetical protein
MSPFAQTQSLDTTFLNTPLTEVLHGLEKEFNVRFAFNPDEVNGIRVHHHFENARISDAIEKMLRGSGMEFIQANDEEYLIRKDQSMGQAPLLIKGLISDRETGNTLAWATVYDQKSKQVAYTDDHGNFQLRLLSGEVSGTLMISYIGYDPVEVPWNQEDHQIEVKLVPSPVLLQEVEVIQRLPALKPDIDIEGYRRSGIVERLSLGSVGVKDELSAFRYLPSINATNDLSSGLRVRGGDESENLYLLDGIEFFNVGHFFGVFSAFDANVIDSTRLYLTNFPVEYGGRTSSVVNMHLKSPADHEFGGMIDAHSLYTHFQVNIPVTKKSAISLATRFTNGNIGDTDIFDVLFENSSTRREISSNNDQELLLSVVPDYRFNDSQIKWQWTPSNSSSISLSFVGGRDNYFANYNVEQETRFQNDRVRVNHLLEERMRWENGGVNLSYDQDVNDYWSFRIDMSGSSQSRSQDLDAAVIIQRLRGVDTISVSNSTTNVVAGGGLKWANDFRFLDKGRITAGLELENHRSELAFPVQNNEFVRRDTSINASLFFSLNLPMSERTDLQFGVRTSHYNLTDRAYLSPRFALTHDISSSWQLGLSAGLYNQFLRALVYEDQFGKMHDFWLLANDSIPVLQSNHYNAHLKYEKGGFLAKAEYFLKNSTNELEQMWVFRGFDPENQEPRVSRFEIFKGDGRAQGLDLLLSYSNAISSTSFSYTYARNTISIPQIDGGSDFPNQNDRRHELTLLNEWYVKSWTLGMGVVYGSGLPYVSALTVDGRDRRELTVEETITRLPDYLRVDAAVSLDFKLWKQNWSTGISVYNLFNRANTDQIQYLYNLPQIDPDSGTLQNSVVGNEIQLLPRTWDLHLTWRF